MSASSSRRVYIDWARGVAVLLMIEAHAVDAWTRASDRSSAAYRDAIVVGGFAAPLFLWLAGLSVALSAARIASRDTRAAAVDAVARRGLEIFVLAFLFRLQAFVITPGSHPLTIFRVDILNIMGPAIAATALVWGLCASSAAAAAVFGLLAAAFALVAPIVRTAAAVDLLPVWVQWYVRPAGEQTTFTAFPWAGFVFAGAAVGVLLAKTARSDERRVHTLVGVAGAVLIASGLYTATLPALYKQASFWTSSPTYFVFRVGVLMVFLAGLRGVESIVASAGVAFEWLARFGRRSLLVYWVHVELVYGYATWPLHHRLPLWGVATAYVLFTAAMYGLAVTADAMGRPSFRRKVVATA